MTKNNLAKNFDIKTLTLFALPTMITMFVESLYTIVDGIFVARFVNIEAFSSINIIMPAIFLFMGIGAMFGVGGSAIIAKKMGEGKYDEARRDFSTIAGVLFTVSIVGTVLCFAFMDEILERLGATSILKPYAEDYFGIILFGLTVFIGQFLFQSFFIVAGEPKMGLISVFSAGFANIILDYVFIVCFDMGIKGAALGTVISSSIPNVIGIIFFCSRKRTLFFVMPAYNPKIIIQSGINGSSSLINFAAEGFIAFLLNRAMLKLLGEIGVAAVTIIAYSEYIFTSILIGYCVGIAPIISFNYGAKEQDKIKKVIRMGMFSVLILSAAILLFMILFAPNIIKIFSKDNTVLYDIAFVGFMIFALKYLVAGTNVFMSVTFTSFSNGKISTVISAVKMFVLMAPMVLFLPLYFGVKGVWIAMPITEAATLVLSLSLFIAVNKKHRYV